MASSMYPSRKHSRLGTGTNRGLVGAKGMESSMSSCGGSSSRLGECNAMGDHVLSSTMSLARMKHQSDMTEYNAGAGLEPKGRRQLM